MNRVRVLRLGCDGSIVEIIVSRTVIESSLRCSIKVARLLISGGVAKPLVTRYTDDEDRRFEAGPVGCAAVLGMLL